MCRSKQQGLCTIWNLRTKSQAKAYKGDQSSYPPSLLPIAIPREEEILQASCRVRHAVWTTILIERGTHTAQASAILAQETSVSTTSLLYLRTERKTAGLCFNSLCMTSELFGNVRQHVSYLFYHQFTRLFLDNFTCFSTPLFPKIQKLAVLTQM